MASRLAQWLRISRRTTLLPPLVSELAEQLTADAAKQVLMKSAITPEALATLSAPEAIAQTAVFLASDMAASVNGQNIVVDRGYFQQPGSTSGLVLKPVFEPL